MKSMDELRSIIVKSITTSTLLDFFPPSEEPQQNLENEQELSSSSVFDDERNALIAEDPNVVSRNASEKHVSFNGAVTFFHCNGRKSIQENALVGGGNNDGSGCAGGLLHSVNDSGVHDNASSRESSSQSAGMSCSSQEPQNEQEKDESAARNEMIRTKSTIGRVSLKKAKPLSKSTVGTKNSNENK